VIAVAASLESASYGIWVDQACALVRNNYLEPLRDAGGVAVLVSTDSFVAEHPETILDRADGLLLIGGSDLDPATYGAARHPETKVIKPERDRLELALARDAIARDMPVLGICRGMQIINVVLGGTLVQHLPDIVGHTRHALNEAGTHEGNAHEVTLTAGSLAARAVGGTRRRIYSHHHQAIDKLGRDLVITARSTLDDLPEAIELPDRQFVLGVQWHPELDPASREIGALVEYSRQAAIAPVPAAAAASTTTTATTTATTKQGKRAGHQPRPGYATA
jgi:putative glutamine amidotransferase